MSASPSRRDLFRGLFAAGLAWLGLPRAAKAAPVTPPPLTDAPSRLTGCHYYACDHSGCVTTLLYDCRSRLVMVQDGIGATLTYSSHTSRRPSSARPPKKS